MGFNKGNPQEFYIDFDGHERIWLHENQIDAVIDRLTLIRRYANSEHK